MMISNLKKRNSSHLRLAHLLWEKVASDQEVAIDATCGNGFDTEVLVNLSFAKVYAIDIQEKAIEATSKRLGRIPHLELIHASHENFPETIPSESVKLIVYNLGYLPGSDKSIKTLKTSTLQSFKSALKLLKKQGLLSIMLYPGHPEGLEEKEAILKWAASLNKEAWSCMHHASLGSEFSPSLLTVERID